jgi:hypothetical protein
MDAGALAVIQRWADTRQRLGPGRSRYLFCTLDGRPLHQTYVRTMMTRYATKAGITKRAHPHGLRHTYAAELAREGIPMNTIQVLLGHTSLATTSPTSRTSARQRRSTPRDPGSGNCDNQRGHKVSGLSFEGRWVQDMVDSLERMVGSELKDASNAASLKDLDMAQYHIDRAIKSLRQVTNEIRETLRNMFPA